MALQVEGSVSLHFFVTNEDILYFDTLVDIVLKESKKPGFKKEYRPEHVELLEQMKISIDEWKRSNPILITLKSEQKVQKTNTQVSDFPVTNIEVQDKKRNK